VSRNVDADTKATRLMWCFLGKQRIPLGKHEAAGDTKSASGPTASREQVLASERSLTCVDVDTLADRRAVVVVADEDGNDNTIVPIFDITISHWRSCVSTTI
jgi:hypothetical protein